MPPCQKTKRGADSLLLRPSPPLQPLAIMTLFCPNCAAPNPHGATECLSCASSLPPQLDPIKETTRPEIRVATHSRELPALPQLLEHAGLDASTEAEDMQSEQAKTLASDLHATAPLPDTQEVERIPADAHRLTLGYDENNDLVIPRPNISGHHAVLAFHQGTYYLQDLQSTNGTFLNRHPIHCAKAYPGDLIGLGSYEFKLDRTLLARLTGEGPDIVKTQSLGAVPMVRPKHVAAQTVVIGRDLNCDIVLDAPQISRQHVRLTSTPTGWHIQDLGSSNKTFLNDRHTAPITIAEATERDILYMGSYRFPISRLKDFLGDHHAAESSVLALPVGKKITTIGRGSENDIVIDAPQVSRHHARLIRKDHALFVEDLASANGTFVNGERVGRKQLLPQDTVSFGTYAVHIDLAKGALQKSYKGDILLQAENIRVDVATPKGPKRLLDGVSFTAYPTEFIGVMGPSGAGKTTLLMSLIGYLRPTYGRTLLNNQELISHYDRYRNAIGYVPQEDIIHGELTVFEALFYTAKLRLPPDTTNQEIARRIEKTLQDLEIDETRDVLIGSPERKGISGGQRKRVNLALELLTQPSLLCLDEPTSGLASEDAANVMRLLRKLSDQGRTVLLTIHQPSLQVYRMLDNVLYLADGEQVYYGPTYPDSMLYFHPGVKTNTPQAEEILADPGSCLRPLVEAKRAGEPMETFAARFRQSSYFDEFVEQRRKHQDGLDLTGTSAKRPPKFHLFQLLILSRRYLTIKFKDRLGMSILMLQAPIIATFIAMVFSSQRIGVLHRMELMPFALFLLVISSIWFGCSNAAREVVSEQAIYRRERMVNLSITAYIGSKILVLALFSLVQCMTLLGIAYATLDLVGNPIWHLGLLWACALAATGMGLLLSTLVRTSAAALALVPLLLIPQVIMGGAIMPVDRMEDPSWTIAHLTLSRWGFEGVLEIENRSDAYELRPEDLPKPFGPGLPAPPAPPNPVDYFFGKAQVQLWAIYAVILALALVLSMMTAAGLKWRER